VKTQLLVISSLCLAALAALALCASVLYSGFILVGTGLTRNTDPILATIWILSVSALAYVTAALYQGAMAPPRTVAAWGPILGIAVGATIVLALMVAMSLYLATTFTFHTASEWIEDAHRIRGRNLYLLPELQLRK
jgi:drug/metabolite transporter (DMT)-like permease